MIYLSANTSNIIDLSIQNVEISANTFILKIKNTLTKDEYNYTISGTNYERYYSYNVVVGEIDKGTYDYTLEYNNNIISSGLAIVGVFNTIERKKYENEFTRKTY